AHRRLGVEHPSGGERPEAIARRGRRAFEQLGARISGAAGAGTNARAPAATAAPQAGLADPATTDPITVGDDPVAILDAFTARNWADGLPIIAPTEERVSAMLGGRDGARSLGVMPPLWRQVTLEKLAVNAVMAGCEPRAFPVVAAAVDAMLDRAFNLYGVQATTHPVAPLLVVNGPYGLELGLHGGSGCFAHGQLRVALGPEHARTIAEDGFARADVQRFVYEHARLPLGRLKLAGMWGMHDWPAWMNAVSDPAALMPQVPSPDDVYVVVA